MNLDLHDILALEPEMALAALQDASRRLLLPVDVDNHLQALTRESLEPAVIVESMKALLEGRNAADDAH